MKENVLRKNIVTIASGLIGALLLSFVSWGNNMILAAWLAPALLIYSFRNIRRWLMTVPIAVLAIGMKIVAMHGGWDIDLVMEIVFGLLVTIPLLAGLYLDRAFHKRLKVLPSTILFPAVFTLLDFLLSLTPVGMTFALSYTISRQLVLIQAAALFGSWFVGFMYTWTASVVVTAVQSGFQWQKMSKTIISYAIILLLVLGYGSYKTVFQRPDGQTVKIGSVTVPHDQDYWTITDKGTSREGSDETKVEMKVIEDELFRLSNKAVAAGAKVIFWSEGNGPMYEDQYETFLEKAKQYAKEHRIYFMPALVVLNYDSFKNENIAVMITPEGEVVYTYEKTISWYPTDSDGIIKSIDTPYGKIGAAICFDMDFPIFINQAGEIDIMLVPAFDTEKIKPYHTEGALLRGVENGFSVIRQCNKGSSIAADYNGNILASQDYFTTEERVMLSDVPTKGIPTLYEKTGEWLFLPALTVLLVLSFFLGCRKDNL